jgi:hypothetical protein
MNNVAASMANWTYDGYWNAVLGANRDADDVIVEFDLNGHRAELDEWLGTAEESARVAGGLEVLPAEWADFHGRALDELAAT